jgi:hypothetical protein
LRFFIQLAIIPLQGECLGKDAQNAHQGPVRIVLYEGKPQAKAEDHYGWHHAVGKRMKGIIGNEHFGDIYVIGGVEIRCAEDGGIFQLWKGQLHGEKVDRAYDPKEQHY